MKLISAGNINGRPDRNGCRFFYPENLKEYIEHNAIYCVGAHTDIAHDIDLAKLTGGDVNIFDPDPIARDYFNNVTADLSCKNQLHFHEYAINIEDKSCTFYKASKPGEFGSLIKTGWSKSTPLLDETLQIESYTLKTVMKMLDHNSIDILKLDAEGLECDILENILECKIHPTIITIDFDLHARGCTKTDIDLNRIKMMTRYKSVIKKLKDTNYNIIHNHNSSYTLLYER